MTREELVNVKGGAINTTAVNTVVKAISTALEFGRTVGSAIRRVISGSKCRA